MLDCTYLIFAEIDSNDNIVRWGYCLEDCPSEEPIVACREEPEFPPYVGENGYHMNFTTEYVKDSNEPLLEMDYVKFECPTGYVFENSTTVNHYAICYNWTYFYTFNHSSTICARKYILELN